MAGECHFCTKRVVHEQNGGNGLNCPNCRIWAHIRCIEGTQFWEETSGSLLSSGTIKTRCPNCGNIEEI